MHALATSFSVLIGAALVLFVWLELHRKREYIAFLLEHPPEVNHTKAQKRASLVECLATGIMLAIVIAALVVLA